MNAHMFRTGSQSQSRRQFANKVLNVQQRGIRGFLGMLRFGCLAWAVALFVSLPALRAATPGGYPVYPNQAVSWLVVGNGTETWTAQENGFKTASVDTAQVSNGRVTTTFVAPLSGTATVTYQSTYQNGGSSTAEVYKNVNNFQPFRVWNLIFYSATSGSETFPIIANNTYYVNGAGSRPNYIGLGGGNVSVTVSYPAVVTVTKTASRSNSGSGAGLVNAGEGEKNLGGFFATPAASQGGSVSGTTYSLSGNNPNVVLFFSDTRTTTTSNPGASIIARTIAPPVVTTQPANQAVTAGAAFTLNVAATGDGSLGYQWYFKGAPTAGATSSSYTVSSAAAANAGDYYALVSNPVGIAASTIATVTVLRTPPVIAPIGGKTVNELEPLSFTASGTSSDAPASSLVFSLDPGAPAGATVTPSGVFTFTPTESQGPGSYAITMRATDGGTPPLNSTATFTVVVNEVNTAPVLSLPTNQFVVDEGILLTFTLAASDADRPANVLSFSLSNAPTGMTVDSSGMVRWLPSEAQGPSTNVVTVSVTDNGSPVLSASSNFTVVVREVNVAPVLSLQPNISHPELTLLVVTNTATDADLPANTLNYVLTGPTNATIDANGVIRWTPLEHQGPSTNVFTTVVSDTGSPARSATNQFTVVVTEVNTAPVFTSLPTLVNVTNSGSLSLQLTGNDNADIPANALTFSKVAGPVDLTVSSSGAVAWTPGTVSVVSNYSVTVRVADNGTSNLTADASFTVAVYPALPNTNCVLAPPGLLAWWSADNTPSDRVGSHHGVLTNGAGFAAGYVSQAFALDGVSKYVAVPDSADWAFGTNEFAIELWANFATVAGTQALLGNDEGPGSTKKWIFWRTGGSLGFHIADGGGGGATLGSAGFDPVVGQWYHVGVTRKGSSFTFYVNGTALSTETSIFTVPDANAPLTIGQAENGFFFAGRLDDVRIYNRALAAGEVLAIFNAGTNGMCLPPSNRPPVLLNLPTTVNVTNNGSLSLTLQAVDADLPTNTLTFSKVSGPTSLTVTAAGMVAWTPPAVGAVSNYSVTVRVTDNGTPNLSSDGTFTVAVYPAPAAPPNQPPTVVITSPASNASFTAPATITLSATAADADGNVARVEFLLNGVKQGQATVAPYNFSFIGVSAGSHTLAARAVDNLGATATASISVTVTNLVVTGRVLRLANVTASSGSTVTVPVELVAQGNENALGFSLQYPTNLLTFVSAAVGSNAAGATLNVNALQTTQGRLGFGLGLGAGSAFPTGVQQVATVTFQLASVSIGTNADVTFGDQPVGREVSDAVANTLTTTYQNGAVTISVGYEADVTPRPNGSGTVSITDWVQVGRFAAGLDTITNSGEFQRADCAPRSSFGNGTISITDWVQAGRYAAGLDPLTPAAGPTSSVAAMPMMVSRTPEALVTAAVREVRVVSTTGTAGQSVTVTLELVAQGDENALGFSVTFDPAVLTYTGAALGAGGMGATLNLNTALTGSGRLGVALALAAGQKFTAGDRTLLAVTFQATDNASVSSAIGFGNTPIAQEVSDVAANVLATSFTGGAVSFGGAVAVAVTPPVIVTNAGQTATFTAVVTGGTATGYQWQRAGTNLPGATSATLILPGITRNEAGAYSVVVATSGGSVTSGAATLRVPYPQRMEPPQRLPNGAIRLVFGDQDGRPIAAGPQTGFAVEVSADLLSTNWVRYTNGFTLTNGMILFEDADAPNHARRFYRVVDR